MEGIIGIIGGAILGAILAYFGIKKSSSSKISEINEKADLTLKEAEISAKRIINDAEINAEKIVSKAERQNESIKQKKIQEAKDKYSKLKVDYESFKSEHK